MLYFKFLRPSPFVKRPTAASTCIIRCKRWLKTPNYYSDSGVVGPLDFVVSPHSETGRDCMNYTITLSRTHTPSLSLSLSLSPSLSSILNEYTLIYLSFAEIFSPGKLWQKISEGLSILNPKQKREEFLWRGRKTVVKRRRRMVEMSSTNVPGERGRERIWDAKRIPIHPWDICARDTGLIRVERCFECPFLSSFLHPIPQWKIQEDSDCGLRFFCSSRAQT